VSCAVVDERHELAGVLVVLGRLDALDRERRQVVCETVRGIAARCTAHPDEAVTDREPDRIAG
jgi:hypothetical protein